jgi:hypothetical protein
MHHDDQQMTEEVGAQASVGEHTRGWLAATQSRAHSVARLAIAEAKLAAISVAMMAFFGTLAAGFVLLAWGLVVAAVLQLLSAQGIPQWLAMLSLALAHVIAAIFLWRTASRLGSNLDFKVTRGELASVKHSL